MNATSLTLLDTLLTYTNTSITSESIPLSPSLRKCRRKVKPTLMNLSVKGIKSIINGQTANVSSFRFSTPVLPTGHFLQQAAAESSHQLCCPLTATVWITISTLINPGNT